MYDECQHGYLLLFVGILTCYYCDSCSLVIYIYLSIYHAFICMLFIYLITLVCVNYSCLVTQLSICYV